MNKIPKPIKPHRFCVLPPLKTHPSKAIGLCTPPFENSPIKSHRFCVLPPLMAFDGWVFKGGSTQNRKITHQSPSVLCTSPFEKSPIKAHRFCVLPPLKNHPSKPIGFVYSLLWKITHQNPSVLCTPPFDGLWWVLKFLLLLKIKRPGRLYWQIRYMGADVRYVYFNTTTYTMDHTQWDKSKAPTGSFGRWCRWRGIPSSRRVVFRTYWSTWGCYQYKKKTESDYRCDIYVQWTF